MLSPCGPGGGTEPNLGDREPERAVTSAAKVAALGSSSTTPAPNNLLSEDEERGDPGPGVGVGEPVVSRQPKSADSGEGFSSTVELSVAIREWKDLKSPGVVLS